MSASPSRSGPLRQLSVVSGARYASEGLFVVRGFALAHLLGPELFGTWSAMRLVRRLGQFSALGATTGMLRLAPVADGRRDRRAADDYRRTAAGVALAGALGFAVLTAASAAGAHALLGAPHLEAWLCLAVVIVLAQLYAYSQAQLQSRQRFTLASAALLCFAVTSTGLGVLAAWGFGLGGFLAALGLSYLLALAGVAAAAGALPRPLLERGAARELLGVGQRIVIAQALNTLHWNVDKLLLWTLAGSVSLGFYAIPTYLTNVVTLLPVAVSAVLYPRLLERLGRSRQSAEAWPYLERANVMLASLAAPAVGLLYLVLHLPFVWFLPDYLPGLAPGRVLLLASFLPVVTLLPSSVLLALGRERTLIAIRGGCAAVSAAAVALTLAGDVDLQRVALATSVGFALKCALTLFASCRSSGLSRQRSVALFARLTAPYAALLGLLLWVGPAPPAPDLRSDLLETFRRVLLVCGPLALWTGFALWRGSRG